MSKIVDENVKYLPQNTIYKNLYSQFFDAGHILPSIEAEGQNDSNSEESENESDMILIKKKKFKIIYFFLLCIYFNGGSP